MKIRSVLLFALCLVYAAEAQSTKQTETDSYINPPLSETKSTSKQKAEKTNKSALEQKKIANETDTKTITTENAAKFDDAKVEILIEENFNLDNEFDSIQSDVDDASIVDVHMYGGNTFMSKLDGEIMDTAEGFVPIPVPFRRRRQEARRRVAARRHVPRKPHRRYFYYYPYSFYRPNSLRYYR